MTRITLRGIHADGGGRRARGGGDHAAEQQSKTNSHNEREGGGGVRVVGRQDVSRHWVKLFLFDLR